MRLVAAVVVGLLLGLGGSLPAFATGAVIVDSKVTMVESVVGNAEMLEIEISNIGDQPTGDLVGHLVVIDPLSDGSADAEDWTTQLTRPVDGLEPGQSTTLLWDVKPISAGTYSILVAVTPIEAGSIEPAVSPNIVFEVAQPSRLVGGAALPVSIVVPAALLGLVVFVRKRERARVAAFTA